MSKLTTLAARLDGIHKSLLATYHCGVSATNASSGSEREAFVANFLTCVLPPNIRLGTGDAVDTHNVRSGQLDVVVERGELPRITAPGLSTNLYLAESIACVIEVKSTLDQQWREVIQTAEKLDKLKREISPTGGHYMGLWANGKIPLFAVGYRGWKNGPAQDKLGSMPIAGILQLDPLVFLGHLPMPGSGGLKAGVYREDGPNALWAFVCSVMAQVKALEYGQQFDLMSYLQASDIIGPEGATPDRTADDLAMQGAQDGQIAPSAARGAIGGDGTPVGGGAGTAGES